MVLVCIEFSGTSGTCTWDVYRPLYGLVKETKHINGVKDCDYNDKKKLQKQKYTCYRYTQLVGCNSTQVIGNNTHTQYKNSGHLV